MSDVNPSWNAQHYYLLSATIQSSSIRSAQFKPGLIIQRSDHHFQEGISEVEEEATGIVSKNEAGVDRSAAEATSSFRYR
jgi:hypothetical protein